MLNYIILGIIQGLTEFFPVSSSAHLVIAEKLMGLSEHVLGLTVVLHLGTALSLIIFFFKDILRLLNKLNTVLLILVVTVITGIIGIAGKDFFEGIFSSVRLVAAALFVTGGILIATKKFMGQHRQNLNFKDAIILGFTQAIAIIPGISRSGITVSTLLFRKIERRIAFEFSFLASIPVILGAAILESKEISACLAINPLYIAAGFIFSFLSGLFSLWALKRIIQNAKLHYFGYYCIAMAVITLVFVKS